MSETGGHFTYLGQTPGNDQLLAQFLFFGIHAFQAANDKPGDA